MGVVAQLLDKYKESRSMKSDSALADDLEITRQTVSQWRAATAYPDEERLADIAVSIKLDPAAWLVAVRAERSSGAAARAYRALAKTLGVAATVCLAVYTPIHLSALPYSGTSESLYIM